MINFKPKAERKFVVNSLRNVTLDGMHQKMLAKFDHDDQKVSKLQDEMETLRARLNGRRAREDVHVHIQLRAQLDQKSQQLQTIQTQRMKYYHDNAQYIFDYFENKKTVESSATGETGGTGITASNRSINDFFRVAPVTTAAEDVGPGPGPSSAFGPGSAFGPDNRERDIVRHYLSNVDDQFFNMTLDGCVRPADMCTSCGRGELIAVEEEGLMICNVCTVGVHYLVENDTPSYKEPYKEVSFYAYKKSNHFKEIIAQFQGKETTTIPPEVLDNIRMQIRKERLQLSELTYYKVKDILKHFGYNKYYEHIPFIKNKLGVAPPYMTPQLEDTLSNLFLELQAPYSKYCPNERVNFLNYYYTLYKLLELLGQAQYLHLIPMLKDDDNKAEQDNIWRLICRELDWEFIPTL